MGQSLAMRGRHGLGDLADELVGVVGLHRPRAEQRGELGGVRQPFVDDVDEVVLLHGVEDLHEAGVAEQGGGTGRGQHGAGSRVVGGEEMDAHRAAQFLIDGAPAAETVQTGDALLQPVSPGELVTAVQIGGRHGGIGVRRFVHRFLGACAR